MIYKWLNYCFGDNVFPEARLQIYDFLAKC